MAKEFRNKLVWNGVTWVEVYHPTSSDIVYVDGGTKTLTTKLSEMNAEIGTHASDPDLHKTPSDTSKLGNLAVDANATYATKTGLTAHMDDDDRHITAELQAKLDNLADDANATYATKEEMAGKKHDYFWPTIADRDANTETELSAGDTCWVADATGDPNVNAPGSAKYMYDGSQWQFLFEADANVQVNWADVIGRPASSVAEIDDAVGIAHEHDNADVLDGLDKDVDGYLTLDGARVGEKYNRVFLQSPSAGAPTAPAVGDVWLQLLNPDGTVA